MLPDPDHALVRKAQAGDRLAFADLVRRHQARVYTLALRMTADAEQARDMAQEAFIQVYRHLNTFKAKSRFTTWLYVVARNVCYSRHKGLAAELRVAWDGDGTGPLDRIAAPGRSPEAQFEAGDDVLQTAQALGELPEKYRLVLTLFHVQGLGHEEIAEVLGLPIGTVKTHLLRGRQLLRVRLTERGVVPS
ncbi:MAG: sigma-70 family RNA polymerase sigma factor [Candidatus Sericytochromatia bacterium]|nr:sigma-70 family RNA polymerase sigma factor [Candidatus Sericytochromatia bacterium]